MPRLSREEREQKIDEAIRLLRSGLTQEEVAGILKINVRTVQRWVADPEFKAKISASEQRDREIIQTDKPTQSTLRRLTEIQEQLDAIESYRESQKAFAIRFGGILCRACNVLDKAVEKLEQNPEEMTARLIPQMMKAVTDASEKVSSAWARATGLEDLLEVLQDETSTDTRQKEA